MTAHEVVMPAGDGALKSKGYAVLPPGAKRGAVVLHEIFGRQPEIDRVVERFGRAGYAAVAPDLYGSTLKPICIARSVREIKSGQGPMIEQIRAARSWLCAESGVQPEHVGLIGFCMGGGFALAAGSGWGAVSTNYGDLPPDEVMRGMGPTIGCYGARDRIFGKQGPRLESRLGALGVEVETHTFDEVGHSFLTDGHHPIAAALSRPFFHVVYNPEVAARAWTLILQFFDRHLS